MRGALQKAVQNSSRCGARTNISRACASAVPEKISLDLKNIRNAEVNSRWTRLKEQRDMCENPLPIDLIPRNVTFTKLGDKLLDLPTAKAALLYAVDLNETHALSALDHSQLWQHVAPKLLNQSVEEGESVEEKFEKYFGYLARCEEKNCTTTLIFLNKSSQNQTKCRKHAVKI